MGRWDCEADRETERKIDGETKLCMTKSVTTNVLKVFTGENSETKQWQKGNNARKTQIK